MMVMADDQALGDVLLLRGCATPFHSAEVACGLGACRDLRVWRRWAAAMAVERARVARSECLRVCQWSSMVGRES